MKEIRTIKAELNVHKEVKRQFLFKKITADNFDRMLDETEYNYKAQPIHRVTYRYTPHDNISEQIEYDATDNLVERHLFNENEEGMITSSIIEFSSGSKTIKTFRFTDLGNADKATVTNEKGEIIGYETFVLDDNQRIISEFESDENHNELRKIDREFDSNGEVLKEIHYDMGIMEMVTTNRYQNNLLTQIQYGKDLESFYTTVKINHNRKGQIIKQESIFHEFGEIETEEFEYDGNDNLISNKVTLNSRIIFENSCAYDSSNRLIEEYFMELDLNGSIKKHERQFHEYID